MKAAGTDIRHFEDFSRFKFWRNLIRQKKFGLTLQVFLKLEYLYCHGLSLLSLNEIGKKSRTATMLGNFEKQVIIKLSLASSSWEIFFIGQNS